MVSDSAFLRKGAEASFGEEKAAASRRTPNYGSVSAASLSASGKFGEVAVGDAFQLGADYVRGETGAEKIAVEGGDFFLVEGAAEMGEAAGEARADERGFVGFGEDGIHRGFDVAVGDTACAQFASDAETSLAAKLGVLRGVVQSVLGVVEIVEFAEARDYGGDEVFIFGAALEMFFHFGDGMGAAHQGALRGHVELGFGEELAGGLTRAHLSRIEQEMEEV